MRTPAKEIIKRRGGITAVANALSEKLGRRVPKTTVQGWWDADRLPPWREDAVLSLPIVEQTEERAA